jgi:anti-sigma factor RsiW
MRHVLTCRDFVEFLDDYLAGSLSADGAAAFNTHLARCPACVAYMKTYRATVELGRAAHGFGFSDDPVPEDVPEPLVRAILGARTRA